MVTTAFDLAQIVRQLAPKVEIQVAGAGKDDSNKEVPLDLSSSKAELGYSPQFPMKEALRDYMEVLWEETMRRPGAP